MRPIRPLFACLLVLLSSPAAPSHAAPAPASFAKPRLWVNGVLDTGQFLPDTTLILRVNDRVLRVRDYIGAYFDAYPEFRPPSDSAGRVQFLNNLVNKEILAKVARGIHRPMTFEDRVTLREHTQRALSNVLFQRAVLDSITIGEDEVMAAFKPYQVEYRLRQLVFSNLATAERMRRDLAAGRISWQEAAAKQVAAKDGTMPASEIGWVSAWSLEPGAAARFIGLKPGEISRPYPAPGGLAILQVAETRPTTLPPYAQARRRLFTQIQEQKASEQAERLLALLRAEIGMVHDTANIAWASGFFEPPMTTKYGAAGAEIEVNPNLPSFAAQDTGRTLATWRDGRLSLGAFLDRYSQDHPLNRRPADTPEALAEQVDAIVLEPYKARLAVERGLDRDSLSLALIEKKREEILVEHLYQDSILSRVSVTPRERRKYYAEHLGQYMTYPRVRYAGFKGRNKTHADSLAARLKAGEKAEEILKADPSAGAIREMAQNDRTAPGGVKKALFEEFRPGEVRIIGPDDHGQYVVAQLISFDAGRQLPFDEVQQYVDESIQNLKAERRLQAFLERHKRGCRIEAHPELVMQIRLIDPAAAPPG